MASVSSGANQMDKMPDHGKQGNNEERERELFWLWALYGPGVQVGLSGHFRGHLVLVQDRGRRHQPLSLSFCLKRT